MNKSWDLTKLQKQAKSNQNFDTFVLNESGILEFLNLNVLDVGCSDGFKTKMLFDEYNQIEKITGIDVDENAIKKAKTHFKNNKKYNFFEMNINDLNSDDKYDIIYLSYVLQHLPNPDEILKKLRELLTDRGVIILKVPDDSFKFCYPDESNLLNKIFKLYEEKIMKKTDITKYTDRYIGKKVYNYLQRNNYKNIKLFYSITDTTQKNIEERMNLFNSSIAFRSAINRKNISDEIKNEMEDLLNQLKDKFKEDNFFFTMSVLYYVAKK